MASCFLHRILSVTQAAHARYCAQHFAGVCAPSSPPHPPELGLLPPSLLTERETQGQRSKTAKVIQPGSGRDRSQTLPTRPIPLPLPAGVLPSPGPPRDTCTHQPMGSECGHGPLWFSKALRLPKFISILIPG